jgi:hypothetical protein
MGGEPPAARDRATGFRRHIRKLATQGGLLQRNRGRIQPGHDGEFLCRRRLAIQRHLEWMWPVLFAVELHDVTVAPAVGAGKGRLGQAS